MPIKLMQIHKFYEAGVLTFNVTDIIQLIIMLQLQHYS